MGLTDLTTLSDKDTYITIDEVSQILVFRGKNLPIVNIKTYNRTGDRNFPKSIEDSENPANFIWNKKEIDGWYEKELKRRKARKSERSAIYFSDPVNKVAQNKRTADWYADPVNRERHRQCNAKRREDPAYRARKSETGALRYANMDKKQYISNNVTYQKRRYATDIIFYTQSLIRANHKRIFRILDVAKPIKGEAVKMLGCTIDEFKTYIEKQFTPEMNWGNRGIYWQFDHKIPLSYWGKGLILERFRAEACHYTNFQPLPKTENMSKGAKYEGVDCRYNPKIYPPEVMKEIEEAISKLDLTDRS